MGTSGAFAAAPWFLLAYLVLGLLGPACCRWWDRSALIVLSALPAATTVWAAAMLPSVLDGGSRTVTISWIPVLSLDLDFRLDALSMIMTLVIAGIGTLVLLYSSRYFPRGDDGLGKYLGSMLVFAGSMLGLVWADNLLLLVIFWELTGLLSYLLIAHRAGKQSSRSAASQAFLTTTAGGLVMLIGAVLLGELADTYRISEIIADPPQGGWVTAAVIMLIVGGITKSAIVPFSFWLPGAMAAPTPASAYLHAATMVKAGLYLFARLAPAFALPDGSPTFWQPLLILLGGATLLYGAVQALRQRDLKLLLAYGTVSQLGLMTLLLGAGNADALLGGMAMLLAHASFKAPLFFVVGIIDETTGTRDLTRLSGLRRRLPVPFWVAVAAGVSMAGVPPMLGFATKEAGYAGLLDGGTWGVVAVALMAVGSALTVTYTIRFLWGAFGDKDGVEPVRPKRAPALMTGPAVLLAVLGLIFGVVPQVLEGLLQSYARTAGETHADALALWHGFNLPLLLSVTGWVVGTGVFLAQRGIERARAAIAAPGAAPGGSYRATTRAVDFIAFGVTSATQRGSLPASMGAILLVLIVFPGLNLLHSGEVAGDVVLGDPAEVAVGAVVLVLAVSLLKIRRALVAVLVVGGIGYAIAVLYIVRGAPDLALTQLLVETVTLIAALLVLTRMPDTALSTGKRGNVIRTVLAIAAGALMTALALIIPGSRTLEPVSGALDGAAVTFGGGHNIVNVILVDVRAWDTYGEITVLVAAATGVASLIFINRRTGSVPRRPTVLPSDDSTRPDRPSPWLATNWSPRRSLLLEVVTRLIFHVIVVFSLFVLFVGHDEPGGGFAAGLIVGLALALRYLAGGAFELGEAAPVDAGILMGIGLLITSVMAVFGLLTGGAALQSTIFEADVAVLGHLKFVTSSLFDIGVYFVVIGLVLDVLRSMGAELDRQLVQDRVEQGQAQDRVGAGRRSGAPATAGSGRGRRR
ncbi:Na+/H+ antiporter subunit A [Nakamurella leprariae]|nr:Na+/H+ antiporter subunit A [Nakamurella leprariae]